MSHERQFRMSDIVPADRLAKFNIAVIGVGAIGRNVALQLAQIGAMNLILIDPDTIEELNVGPQGFRPVHIGCYKVAVIQSDVKCLNPDIRTLCFPDEYKSEQIIDNTIIFACVDSMAVRRNIFEDQVDKFQFFCDGRMSAETCRILTTDNSPKHIEHYRSTLHTDDESIGESCTAKATCYCANIAAGFMLSQFTQWLRGFPLMSPEIICNILAAEMTVIKH